MRAAMLQPAVLNPEKLPTESTLASVVRSILMCSGSASMWLGCQASVAN